MATETMLRDLFMDELKDMYHAEKQLTKALPKLAKAATSPELREAFESHLEETQGHVQRLEQVFQKLDEAIKTKPCAGMSGIIEEGAELIKAQPKGPALDAGLIAGAQRAEHYEMAVYGSLIAWAKCLDTNGVVELLEATLDEEKAADEKLSALGEDGINEAAAGGAEAKDGEGENEEEDDDPAVRQAAARPGMSKSTSKSTGMRANAARK